MGGDSRPLSGQVIVVTGASRGLGRSIALQLAGSGALSVALYRSAEEEARSLIREAETAGGHVETVKCDVSQRTQVEEAVDAILDRHGRIDGLINNAGIWRGGRLDTLPEEDWRAVLETNLFGTFHVTQCVLPSMLRADAGRIVNVASVIGLTGYAGDCAYASAKAGIIAFTKSLAKELARTGVIVNAVAPGTLETDMTMSLGREAADRLLKHVPMKRRGHPEEVAQVVDFLMTAPPYMRGSIVIIDGAMT